MRTKNVPVDLEPIRVDLAAWRAQRRKGERIPAEIWQRVVGAVRQHGLKVVSETLRLNYDRLQRKVGGGRSESPVFVELGGARTEEGLSCVVELEKGNGTRLRIRVREAAGVDWGKVKEAFLGA